MRPEVFEIEVLNRPMLSFFSGETIHGMLHIVVGPTQKYACKGIRLIIKGKGAVRWTEQVGNTRAIYTGAETYFDNKQYLLGDGGTEVVLSPGNYDYPFQFTLPLDLPSSFLGPCGSIRYKIQTEMITGAFKSNHKAKVPFSLNSIVDLNVEPLAAEPIQSKRYKSLCCLCCKSGPLGVTMTLPKSGYVSGEYIKFTAEFINQSRKSVKSVSAFFVQKVIYRARSKSRKMYTNLCCVAGPSVEPGDSEIWTVNTLEIPPLPPTSKPGRIIEVQYLLKIQMRLSGTGVDLTHEVPIIIGSIPLRGTFQEINRLQLNNTDFTAAEPPSYLRTVTAMDSSQLAYFQQYYPDLPPPSYADAMLQPYSDSDKSAGTGEGRSNFTFEGDDPINSISNPIPLTAVAQQNKFAPQYVTYSWVA